MNIIISFFVTVIGMGICVLGLDKTIVERIPLFRNSDPDEIFTSKEIGKFERVILLCIGAVVCFASAMKIFDRVGNALGIAKMLICLLCMIGAAAFDYRERRIPNIFPATMAISAIVLLVAGVVLGQEGAVAYITTGVVAAVICGLILVASAAVTKQGIGAGDIKLICAMALIAGVYAVMGTLFFGVVLCSVYAIFVLLIKKKTASSAVPFAPFLLFGYVLTLFMINF